MSEPATGVSDRRKTVESALARVLEWDLDSYLELFEKDAITESTPAGFPWRMEGAASIRVQLASLWKRAQESGRRFVGYDPLNIYEGSDSGVVVAYCRCETTGAQPQLHRCRERLPDAAQCHRISENQPLVIESKPATRVGSFISISGRGGGNVGGRGGRGVHLFVRYEEKRDRGQQPDSPRPA